MRVMSRRFLLTMLTLTPMSVAAAAEERSSSTGHKLSGRDRIRMHHLPNIPMTTHTGRQVRFYDDLVKDKKVIINFMYVKCDGICVPVTSHLVRVQKLLGDRVGRDIFMYSITLKPSEDSPEDLRQYARQHGVGAGWVFLTGAPRDIDHLRRALGFAYPDPKEDADLTNHVGMVRYGDEPLTRWAACPGMANPEHIARSILWDLA